MSENDPRPNPSPAEEPWFALVRALVHDLRTPIATASGYLELIELDAPGLPAQQAEYLARAAIAVREISSLTTMLMEVARLEGGTRTARLAEADAARLLDRILSRRRPLERAGIELASPTGPAAGGLRCDVELVDRALDALIDFALARSPRESKVKVGLLRGARQVRFTVRDHGTPIDDERLAQLSSHRRASGEGTSAARLALVFCRLVAAAHGGAAGAERPPDGGMELWLELPA